MTALISETEMSTGWCATRCSKDGKETAMKKILVVVDMQNDFVDGSLGTPEAQGILDAVVKKVRS